MKANDRLILKLILDELGLTESNVYTRWEGDRLVELSLSNKNINNLPTEICNLTVLETLTLSNNNLNSLPPEIGNLKALKWFYINNNNLNSLPPEMGNLTELIVLSISNNNLNNLPKEISNMKNLATLSLNGNNLNNLPKEIGGMKELTILSLDGNNLAGSPGVLVSSKIGRRNAQTAYFIEQNRIWCNGLSWRLKEFENIVLIKHPKGKHHNNYMKFIKQCKEER